jgi:hypothetical protein
MNECRPCLSMGASFIVDIGPGEPKLDLEMEWDNDDLPISLKR